MFTVVEMSICSFCNTYVLIVLLKKQVFRSGTSKRMLRQQGGYVITGPMSGTCPLVLWLSS